MTDLLAKAPIPAATSGASIAVQGNKPDPRSMQRVQLVRKVVLLVAILAVIALAMVTAPGLPGHALQAVLTGGGVIAVAIAVVGRAWCSLYIGGRKKTEIVDRGPYSVTRNPLYVFSFIGAFGMGAQTGSLMLATVFMAIAVIVFVATVKHEEAWLQAAFGAGFARYRNATPRFWPRWSNWRDEAELTVVPRYFLTTLRDGAVMFLAVPLFRLIAVLHETHTLPTVFRFI